jgi:MoxR-like ATPase
MPAMEYHRLFNPPPNPESSAQAGPGDRRDGAVYLHTPQSVLAVNVALATGRPLLVRGPSGCGKSSLAPHVAGVMGFRFYDRVVTSRTQARDLLWEIDQLQRLSDANVGKLGEIAEYVRPGVLWWAFDPKGAAQRMPPAWHATHPQQPGNRSGRAVVLLDEIDKADPDVPNNLLVALGSLEFTVDETGQRVAANPQRGPLVVLTTNDERELPGAFLRRCVELVLDVPGTDRLTEIGALHFPDLPRKVIATLATLVSERDARASTGEFLDTVRACRDLNIGPGSEAWIRMLDIVMAPRDGADALP